MSLEDAKCGIDAVVNGYRRFAKVSEGEKCSGEAVGAKTRLYSQFTDER